MTTLTITHRDGREGGIVTITDQDTGKKYRCHGGNYDMTGTSFGMWLDARYHSRLEKLAYNNTLTDGGPYRQDVEEFYGLFVWNDGRVTVDGACGINSMQRIAEAIGLELERTYIAHGARRGHTTGWIITDNRKDQS